MMRVYLSVGTQERDTPRALGHGTLGTELCPPPKEQGFPETKS